MKKRYVAALILAASLAMGNMAYAQETEATQEMETMAENAAVEEEAEAETYAQGDAVDLTKDELLSKVKDAMSQVTSVKEELSMDLVLDLSIGGEESETSMSMSMLMNMGLVNEEILEPYASHQTQTMYMSVMGQSETEIEEKYTREENGRIATYSGVAENGVVDYWSREEGDEKEFTFSQSSELLEETDDMVLLDQKAVDGDGKEYYVLEGKVDLNQEEEEDSFQEEVKDMLEELEESMGAEDSLEFPDVLILDVYIDAESMLPVDMRMDMSGIKGSFTDDSMEGMIMDMTFTTMLIQFKCSDFNQVADIVFPENLPAPETGELQILEEEVQEAIEDAAEEVLDSETE